MAACWACWTQFLNSGADGWTTSYEKATERWQARSRRHSPTDCEVYLDAFDQVFITRVTDRPLKAMIS